MRNKSLLILLIIALFSILKAEKMVFDITFIGLPVVKSVFEINQNSIVVTAKSTGFAKVLKNMDNKYIAKYPPNDSLFLSDFYKKIIVQKDYKEKRMIHYNRNEATAQLIDFYHPKKSKNYKIPADVRDFFSTLFYLRKNLNDTLSFNIDANSVFWKGFAKLEKEEEVKINDKIFRTKKYKITYRRISKEVEKENSDMLTNNLVGNSKTLYLWFSSDKNRVPVKAQFKMKPFSVYWYLREYRE